MISWLGAWGIIGSIIESHESQFRLSRRELVERDVVLYVLGNECTVSLRYCEVVLPGKDGVGGQFRELAPVYDVSDEAVRWRMP